MNINNFIDEKLLEEQNNWRSGENNYFINNKLYDLIINDLSQNLDNIILNYNEETKILDNYDLIINTFPPNKFTELQNSAIKIFVKTNLILDFWDISTPYIYGKRYMNIDVVELWKNEKSDTFTIFATAERSDNLNNLYKSNNLQKYIEYIFKDIFNKDIEIIDTYVNFWEYGYHFPSNINKKDYLENELSCGEWISDKYDCSLSGSIETAINLSKKIINLIEK